MHYMSDVYYMVIRAFPVLFSTDLLSLLTGILLLNNETLSHIVISPKCDYTNGPFYIWATGSCFFT